MLELTALVVVVILYIIPLNIPLYHISELSAAGILNNEEVIPYISALFYVLYAAIIFASVYFAIKFIVLENNDAGIDKEAGIRESLSKHAQGQKTINLIAACIMLLLILLHVLLMVFDIKITVMALLCIVFIFRDIKPERKSFRRNRVKKG